MIKSYFLLIGSYLITSDLEQRIQKIIFVTYFQSEFKSERK